MKKILLALLFTATTVTAFGQKDSTARTIQKNAESIGQGGNNELKINLLNSILGMPEISYEHLLADNMGVGASAFVGLNNDIDLDFKFGFVPHFRVYFGQKKASGFFIEGNAGIITVKERYFNYEYLVSSYYSPETNYESTKEVSKTNFGLGAAAGAKFLTRNGFLGEVYLGLGRFLGENNSIEAYPRIGITIGKRF